MGTIEKIVIKGSNTTYILKDSNALPSGNVTQDINADSTAEQVPSAKAVYEMDGSGGAAAGFGTPEASATQLESTQPPTATVEASGPNTAKIFKFSFGIPQGTKGDKGDTGAKGDPGEKGNTGATGAPGKDGTTPTIGENGNWYLGDTDTGKPSRGATGAQGAQGPQGEKGDTGAQGPQGETGATGATGAAGKDGITPIIGENGNWYLGDTDTGKPSRGATGAQGPQGATGAQGPQGETGAQGPQGETGATGATGAVFTPSVDTSGNISWTNNGSLENPETRNIRGPQGATGDTGAQGPKGDTGPQGPAGSDANVTTENIETALGYTPLQESDIVTETSEVLPDYTNQIPSSIDASGAVLNGVGYQASATLDMTGAVASGSSFVSGFIPVKKGDVIRVKDPSSTTFSTGLVFALYKADKATGSNIGRYINTMQANSLYGAVTISGNTLTWDTSSIGYYFWNDFAFLRVTTNSAASIVTVNEEITETTQVVKTLNSNIKVGKNNLSFDFNAALLADKKIVIFGDSIIGATRDQTSVPAYAAAYTGATIYNVGFGGCRMSVHPTAGYAAFSMWALADAIATNTWTTQDAQASSGADYFPEQLALLKSIDFSTVDEIVIHYGTNDFAANVQIDNGSNTTSTSTVCGALRYSIQKILGAYPKIKIFVSLPIYRMWNSVGAETYTNGLGKKLPEYNAAMQAVAESYNLPAIDGYGKLGINSLNDSAYSSDGTHLNDLGRQIFGQLIGGCLISGEGSPSGGDATVQSVNGSTGAIKTTSTFNATATDSSFTPSFSAGDATTASEQGYMCVLNIQGEFPVLPDGGSTTMSFYLMPVVLASTVELWGGSFVNPFTGAVVVMTYGFNNGSTVALYKTLTADS